MLKHFLLSYIYCSFLIHTKPNSDPRHSFHFILMSKKYLKSFIHELRKQDGMSKGYIFIFFSNLSPRLTFLLNIWFQFVVLDVYSCTILCPLFFFFKWKCIQYPQSQGFQCDSQDECGSWSTASNLFEQKLRNITLFIEAIRRPLQWIKPASINHELFNYLVYSSSAC